MNKHVLFQQFLIPIMILIFAPIVSPYSLRLMEEVRSGSSYLLNKTEELGDFLGNVGVNFYSSFYSLFYSYLLTLDSCMYAFVKLVWSFLLSPYFYRVYEMVVLIVFILSFSWVFYRAQKLEFVVKLYRSHEKNRRTLEKINRILNRADGYDDKNLESLLKIAGDMGIEHFEAYQDDWCIGALVQAINDRKRIQDISNLFDLRIKEE